MEQPKMMSKEDYDLCERENSNLRKALHWAAQRLPKDQLTELAQMIRKRPIEEGGISADEAVDVRVNDYRIYHVANELADFVDEIIETDNVRKLLDDKGYQMSSNAASLRDLLGPLPPPPTFTEMLDKACGE